MFIFSLPGLLKCTLFVFHQVLFDPYFRGQLRKEGIRSFEKDKVEVYKRYRPGDIVLAKVLSLGEASPGKLKLSP